MTSTALQRQQNIPSEITQAGAGTLAAQGPINGDDWRTLAQIANIIGNTEFVPKGLRGNKPAVMACLLYGRDQGVGPMIALNEISVVQGRPTMSANLMSAKARANGHKISRVELRDEQGDIIGVTAKGVRSDGTEDEVTWTLKDAKRAKLADRDTWQKYPRQMLWARAVSELCRSLFSDIFFGAVYTEEEMGSTLEQHDAMDAEFEEVAVVEQAPGAAPTAAAVSAPQRTPPRSPGAEGGGNGDDGAGENVAGSGPATDDSPAATATTVFDQGKHKGKTVAQVAHEDPAFLWGAANYKTGELGRAIKDYLAEYPDTPKTNAEAEQTVIDA